MKVMNGNLVERFEVWDKGNGKFRVLVEYPAGERSVYEYGGSRDAHDAMLGQAVRAGVALRHGHLKGSDGLIILDQTCVGRLVLKHSVTAVIVGSSAVLLAVLGLVRFIMDLMQ